MKNKTALEQLEYWIEKFYKVNGTPTLGVTLALPLNEHILSQL